MLKSIITLMKKKIQFKFKFVNGFKIKIQKNTQTSFTNKQQNQTKTLLIKLE